MTIDYKNRKPIYEQLVDNINNMVIRGIYPPHFQLPSVRQLAVEIGINPNTIQKAYAELERQGTIYSLTGRGSFICGDHDELIQKFKERIKVEITQKIEEAIQIATPKREIVELVDQAYQKTEKGGTHK